MYELSLVRRVNFSVQQMSRKEINWLTIILNSDCPRSLGHWQMWAALLTVHSTGRKRGILWCVLFHSVFFQLSLKVPFYFSLLFLSRPVFSEFSFSKVRGLKLCWIPFWSVFFFPLNSYVKSPHHPTSHSSHLPAASISKFLSIPEFYINFRELRKTKYISINTSVASLKALCQFFSSVNVLFIKGLICHRLDITAQVLLDSFKQMILQHFLKFWLS